MPNGPSPADIHNMPVRLGTDYIIDEDEVWIVENGIPGETIKWPPTNKPGPSPCRVLLQEP